MLFLLCASGGGRQGRKGVFKYETHDGMERVFIGASYAHAAVFLIFFFGCCFLYLHVQDHKPNQ